MRAHSSRLSSGKEPCAPSNCVSPASSLASEAPLADAICRRTRSSALAATRASNASRGGNRDASVSRRSAATASRISFGTGSSCIALLPEILQQVELALRGPARDHRALDATVAAAAEPIEHAGAHEAPAQAPEDLPVANALTIHWLTCGDFV